MVSEAVPGGGAHLFLGSGSNPSGMLKPLVMLTYQEGLALRLQPWRPGALLTSMSSEGPVHRRWRPGPGHGASGEALPQDPGSLLHAHAHTSWGLLGPLSEERGACGEEGRAGSEGFPSSMNSRPQALPWPRFPGWPCLLLPQALCRGSRPASARPWGQVSQTDQQDRRELRVRPRSPGLPGT